MQKKKLETLVHPSKRPCVLPVYVDDIKMAGRRESSAPMWARLRRKIELEDPTPQVDRVYLGALRE